MKYSATKHPTEGFRPIQPFFVLSTQTAYLKHCMNAYGISHFYSFTVNQPERIPLVVPDASIDVLFSCGTSASPKVRVCGSSMSAKTVELELGQQYFGVRFNPGFLPGFLPVLPKDLINKELPLADFSQPAQELSERIADSDHFTERIDLFLYTYRALLECRYQPNLCAALSQLMNQNMGNIRISELEQHTRYSARSINKIFTDYYGFSPKIYCLILRFQYSLFNITRNRHRNLTSLALNLGYADQSHFLREFKKFAAMSPKHFSKIVLDNDYQGHIDPLLEEVFYEMSSISEQ